MIDSALIVERVDAIGTLPTSAAHVFALVNDAKATLEDFERVLRPDVGLTANLLRCANSAYYRATREMTSVKDAIGRMGMRRVFEVVAGATFAQTIPSRLAGYGLDAAAYWEHSVAVAVLADRIGREVGFTYPDLAFTAGLLHDLGKVVIASFLEQPGTMMSLGLGSNGLRSCDQELAVLGVTHAQMGEALTQKWNLPKDICGAARWHHSPMSAPTATLRYLSTVVQVADAAATVLGEGKQCGINNEGVDPLALERLNLEVAALGALVEGSKDEIKRTSELLKQASPRRSAA